MTGYMMGKAIEVDVGVDKGGLKGLSSGTEVQGTRQRGHEQARVVPSASKNV